MKKAIQFGFVLAAFLAISVDCNLSHRMRRAVPVPPMSLGSILGSIQSNTKISSLVSGAVSSNLIQTKTTPLLLKALLKAEPTTNNPGLNSLISVLKSAALAVNSSATGKLSTGQMLSYGNMAATALGNATGTSPANMTKLKAYVMKVAGNATRLDAAGIVGVLVQASSFLGNGTAAGRAGVTNVLLSAVPTKLAAAPMTSGSSLNLNGLLAQFGVGKNAGNAAASPVTLNNLFSVFG